MIDKMILSVFIGLLTVILGIQLLLCSLPLFKRLEYDAVCQKYSLQMDSAGGLTPGAAAQLVQDLEVRGFTVSQLSATEDADFGDELALHVTSSFAGRQLHPDFSMGEVALSFTYSSSTVCRFLKNVAVAP